MDEELHQEFASVRTEFSALRGEMARSFDAFRVELRETLREIQQENAAEHAKTRRLFVAAVTDMRRHFDLTVEDMRRHFDITVEHIGERVDTVIESVGLPDGKLDRQMAHITSEMRAGFSETRALIRFVATQ